MRLVALPLFVLLLGGCAATSTTGLPEGYSGEMAMLDDTAIQDSSSRGTFFVAIDLDGRRIGNAINGSLQASQAQGFGLRVQRYGRAIPVAKVKVNVRGTHLTAAPIQEIAARAAGTFYSVDGVVDFEPKSGMTYVVTGELSKERSCVWIAERASKEPVTTKACSVAAK